MRLFLGVHLRVVLSDLRLSGADTAVPVSLSEQSEGALAQQSEGALAQLGLTSSSGVQATSGTVTDLTAEIDQLKADIRSAEQTS